MRLRYLPALVVAILVLPAVASAVDAKPVSPAGGASVVITPKPGFGNGDAKLTWRIAYGADCPGPDSIHSSWAELKEPGYDWRAEQRDGPFLGDGAFTTRTTLFPGKTARKIEWRVAWACGATTDFAGAKGTSATTHFALQPLGTTSKACAGLSGTKRALCLAKDRRAKALRRCAALATSQLRTACSKKARDAYARAVKNA
jgi:hypothetical protein